MSKALEHSDSTELVELVRVGIIQTTLNHEIAWEKGPQICEEEAQRTRIEIQRAVGWLMGEQPYPHFILLPELAVPRCLLGYLEEICRDSGAVLIAGADYNLDHASRTVQNEAFVLVPDTWPTGRAGRAVSRMVLGKTYAAPGEDRKLQASGWTFRHDPNLWIFDSGMFGRFGVCICYDLMDVERPVLYRGVIHHLFVLAYNQDTASFAHIAEAVCRTVYCNVVVCNTGFYGGSVALTPYYHSWRRPTYRLEGHKLASVQTVELPVRSMDAAWKGTRLPKEDVNVLKELPPRYGQSILLERKDVNVAE